MRKPNPDYVKWARQRNKLQTEYDAACRAWTAARARGDRTDPKVRQTILDLWGHLEAWKKNEPSRTVDE